MPNKNEKNNVDNIDSIIENTFQRLRNVIDANTIIGKTINIKEDVFVIPISKVNVGLVTGGGEFPFKKKKSTSLGSSTGFSVVPIGFLSISGQNVEYISAQTIDNSSAKMVDMLINLYDKFVIKNGESNEKEN